MSIKKPYIQVKEKRDKHYNICYHWLLYGGNGVAIAQSRNTWYKIKPCRQSAHRASIKLNIEIKPEVKDKY